MCDLCAINWPSGLVIPIPAFSDIAFMAVGQDLLGGHAAEAPVCMPRHNAVTGAAFVWEQERFDPVTRRIFCYISLRDPASRQVPTTKPSQRRGQMPKTHVCLSVACQDPVHTCLQKPPPASCACLNSHV